MGGINRLSADEITRYLDRIGCADYPRDATPTRALLDRLTLAHARAVPFDTRPLVATGQVPSLALDRLFDKIVAHRGGGYCFELNALFDALLAGLGFDVRPCLCRSVVGDPEPAPVDHRGELVTVEGTLLYADVGFGGPACALPIPVEEGVRVNDGMHAFSVERVDDCWWNLNRACAGWHSYANNTPDVRTELMFCTASARDTDFELLNVAQSSERSIFRENEYVNLRLEDGALAITNLAGKRYRASGAEALSFASAAERDDYLARAFGI